jgi:hypothetical protein
MQATCQTNLILLDLIIPTIWRRLQITKFINVQFFFQPAITSYPLGPNILRSALYSHTLSPCASLNVRDQVSHPYKAIGQACPTRRPRYTFLAPNFTLPALTLIQISRKKYFWITVCFNSFRSTPMNTVFPLLKSCFLLYPFYCP